MAVASAGHRQVTTPASLHSYDALTQRLHQFTDSQFCWRQETTTSTNCCSNCFTFLSHHNQLLLFCVDLICLMLESSIGQFASHTHHLAISRLIIRSHASRATMPQVTLSIREIHCLADVNIHNWTSNDRGGLLPVPQNNENHKVLISYVSSQLWLIICHFVQRRCTQQATWHNYCHCQ